VKLTTWYCGPFEILKRTGPVAYRFLLPPIMKVHDVFRVSLLKRYVKDVYHVIDWYVLQVKPKGKSQVESQCIL